MLKQLVILMSVFTSFAMPLSSPAAILELDFQHYVGNYKVLSSSCSDKKGLCGLTDLSIQLTKDKDGFGALVISEKMRDGEDTLQATDDLNCPENTKQIDCSIRQITGNPLWGFRFTELRRSENGAAIRTYQFIPVGTSGERFKYSIEWLDYFGGKDKSRYSQTFLIEKTK